MYTSGVHGRQKKVLDPLGLELHTVASCYVGSGTQAWIPCKRSQVFLTAKPSFQAQHQVFKILDVALGVLSLAYFTKHNDLQLVPSMLLQMPGFYLCCGCVAFHCAHVAYFLYSQIGWWALRLFQCLFGCVFGDRLSLCIPGLNSLCYPGWPQTQDLCLYLKTWGQRHVTPCLALAFLSNCE